MEYKKIEIGNIKTTKRVRKGKNQTMKLFSKSQKRMIIQEVLKGTMMYDLRIEDVLLIYGVSAPVYYSWVRKGNSEPETKRIFIRIKSGVDLLKLSDKLKEIEEIESVIFT